VSNKQTPHPVNETKLIQAAAHLCCDGIRDIAPRFSPVHADSKQQALNQSLASHRRLHDKTDVAIDHWLTQHQIPNVSEEVFEQVFFRLVGFRELFEHPNPIIRGLAVRDLSPDRHTAEGLVRHATITFWRDSQWPRRLLTLILQRVEFEEPLDAAGDF